MAQYGPCCLLPFFVYPFPCKGEKWLEVTSRAAMEHILGPKCRVSIATMVRFLLAITMEIWDRQCGPFWAIFVFFCHFRPGWEYQFSMGQGTLPEQSRDSCSI